MKKICFLFIVFIYSFINMYSQSDILIQDRDVKVVISIEKISDTVVDAKCWILNKSKYPIYYTQGTDTLNYEARINCHPIYPYQLLVDISTLIKSCYSDWNIEYQLLTLSAKDTVSFHQIIFVENVENITKLKVDFDYLNIEQYEKDIQDRIIVKNKKESDVICYSYRDFCDYLIIEVAFKFP